MILSRSFGFLFIKNKKTAGTSLEIALSRHCREDDIVTPLPTANSTQRRDRRPAREILSDEQKAIIREVCADEMELLGYEP